MENAKETKQPVWNSKKAGPILLFVLIVVAIALTFPRKDAAGRLFFVGDSRTIDMFADSDETLESEEHDGVLVSAWHGRGFDYLDAVVVELGIGEGDTLVSWMGANDRGNFAPYGALYDRLLSEGITLIVCTVGPTDPSVMEDWYRDAYENTRMEEFNRSLVTWAASNNVPVIDLYAHIKNNVEIDAEDGIHYLPRPDPALWDFILDKLKAYGAL